MTSHRVGGVRGELPVYRKYIFLWAPVAASRLNSSATELVAALKSCFEYQIAPVACSHFFFVIKVWR